MKDLKAQWMVLAVLACAVAFTPQSATAQGGGTKAPALKDDLFAGTEKFAQGASSVTQIEMDPESLGMVGGGHSEKAKRMVLSVVHTYSYDKPGMYKIEDVEEFRRKLEAGDWHCSVHVREMKTGESTDVCNRRRTDDMVESAIITVEPKSLTFIHQIMRKGGPGQSESSEFLMMPDFGGLPALAMLEPRLLGLQMQMRLGGLSGLMIGQPALAFEGFRALDSADMQKRMAEAEQQMAEASKRMRELDMPAMQKKMDEAMKQMQRHKEQ